MVTNKPIASSSGGTLTKPRDQAIHLLDAALATGIRGTLRDAIRHALNVARESEGDLTDMHYRHLAAGARLADPRRPGLIMRANRSAKLWLYRFDHPITHKQTEMRLGIYPDVPLAAARERWQKARKARLQGLDPLALAEGPTIALPTVRALCERYIKDYANKVKRTALEDEKLLERELLYTYGASRVDDLSPEAITATMFAIKDRGSPRQAEKFRACMSTVFRVALGKSRKIDYPDGPWLPADFRNPMEAVPQLAEREAFSTDLKVSELRAFLHNLHTVDIHATIANALRFQLQTCARISEVLNLPWSEIDFEEGIWTLPAARSKNKLEHRVMLSVESVELLEGIRPFEEVSPYVFPSITRPPKPLRKDVVLEALRRHRQALGLPEGAASHALRHTCITQLASMGCPRDVRDRIANHKPPSNDMDARYNRYSLDAEARNWLQRWSDRLTGLAADNVVSIERKGV